jgi:hypothetical protein
LTNEHHHGVFYGGGYLRATAAGLLPRVLNHGIARANADNGKTAVNAMTVKASNCVRFKIAFTEKRGTV